MKFFSYLNTAARLLQLYKGNQPFHLFIKDFFREHKKYGSSDRKHITHLCYCCFRLGQSVPDLPMEERILLGLFLCSSGEQEILAALKPGWTGAVSLTPQEKCAFLGIDSASLRIFPHIEALSNGIDASAFAYSHFTQPDAFLRIRPGMGTQVLQQLETAGIDFTQPEKDCIALPNGTKTEGFLQINRQAVVQDYSSQRTGRFMSLVAQQLSGLLKVWDCCAASGGKSILAKDLLGDIDLTVSDIRENILQQLRKRLAEAGIRGFNSMATDLSTAPRGLLPSSFDLIIADVPCTGSGTWGRTPERLSFFDPAEITRFRQKQESIIRTVMPYLREGGFLLYITCSVWKQENEEITDFILHHFPVQPMEAGIISGYCQKADTMFAALFKCSTDIHRV